LILGGGALVALAFMLRTTLRDEPRSCAESSCSSSAPLRGAAGTRRMRLAADSPTRRKPSPSSGLSGYGPGLGCCTNS